MHPPLRDGAMGRAPVTRQRPWSRERCRGLASGVGLPEVWESPKVAMLALWASAFCLRGFVQGFQGVLLGAVGWVQCHVFEPAKRVSAFLFCLAKD